MEQTTGIIGVAHIKGQVVHGILDSRKQILPDVSDAYQEGSLTNEPNYPHTSGHA